MIGMKDMFNSLSMGDTTIRKVLIEGEPGIGKTTLCCKLAYDWAKGSQEAG